MFGRLSEGFGKAFRKLSGQGQISEKNVRDAMDDVRTALLEADVHHALVDEFCEDVVGDALGTEVLQSLKPGEQMVGIVHRRLVEFLGGEPDEEGRATAPPPEILKVSPGPTVVMMCGLQGSGKTTTCGKLAAYLKKRGRSVMLCAADLQRPAAVEQLEIVAKRVREEASGGAQVHFYGEPEKCAEYGKAVGVAVQVCRNALNEAKKKGVDVLILDTAGRLHVNDELMGELQQVNRALTPHHIFLVVDAMTGQDAVNSAKAFHERLEVDGVVLTKFDSDTRGGAALSVKKVTGAPIKFIGVGEKWDALEEFHAERMAGRILGMGDVVSLVEKAAAEVSEEEAERLQAKMAKGEMTMEDFVKQLRTLRRMGPLKQVLGLLPGLGSMLQDAHIDDKQLDRVEAMIGSMTKAERRDPSIVNISRRKRIARGSGSTPEQVAQLVKQFETLNKLTKTMANMSARQKVAAVKDLGGGGMGGMMPGLEGLPSFSAKGSTKASSGRFKQRKKRR
ncbi:MAG TPA: signal recognition particle protein [Phycisphaerales bacterium]|nr:signal recognition particle protein [Phycisphaerales bacterium]